MILSRWYQRKISSLPPNEVGKWTENSSLNRKAREIAGRWQMLQMSGEPYLREEVDRVRAKSFILW